MLFTSKAFFLKLEATMWPATMTMTMRHKTTLLLLILLLLLVVSCYMTRIVYADDSIRTYSGHTNDVNSVFVSGNNLFSGSYDKTIKQWDIITGGLIRTYIGHIRVTFADKFRNAASTAHVS